jgi:tetratricopeptide (TPR) repeat protein
MSKSIESAIRVEDWEKARRLILAELRKKPESHWLLARLSLTYYEHRSYKRSLHYLKRARRISPKCPLVLWDYAGTLQMLGFHRRACAIYQHLIGRGPNSLAYGPCGEGRAWARRLIADCFYRQAISLRDLGQVRNAARMYRHHLALRGPGCRSIYSIRIVRKELSKLSKV